MSPSHHIVRHICNLASVLVVAALNRRPRFDSQIPTLGNSAYYTKEGEDFECVMSCNASAPCTVHQMLVSMESLEESSETHFLDIVSLIFASTLSVL